MANKQEPSYTALVYEVVRTAGRPLTFQEIFDEVHRRRPITTKNPKGTIRNAVSNAQQIVNLGDRRYGYLPQLLAGSVLRLPLTEKKPAHHPLLFPWEIVQALWPGFFDGPKYRDDRHIRVRLPSGEVADLPLEFFGPGVWGSPMTDALRTHLVEHRAGADDALLIRIVDGEAGLCDVWFEARRKRDEAAIAERNRELADAAEPLFRPRPTDSMPNWDLAIRLLARGAYRSEVAPDSLRTVLDADPRFVSAGSSAWMLASAVTPEIQLHIRERERLEQRLLHLGVDDADEPEFPPFPPTPPPGLEQAIAELGALLDEQGITSVEEASAFLQNVLGQGGPLDRGPETPLERAQDLIYDALESSSSRKRVRLAREALKISPDCADAYNLLAQETAKTPEQAADLYGKGVAAAERALGPELFQEEAGNFWLLLETRPYMRARLGLAQALWALGERSAAIAHVRDLLRLNPNDNQGLRYQLLNWLLELGDDAETGRVLDMYPDDAAPFWTYGRALHAFRTEGDTRRSRKLRRVAEELNPYVPAYLLGKKRLPRDLPELIGFGDDSEAVMYAADNLMAWQQTPGALAWLAGRPTLRPVP